MNERSSKNVTAISSMLMVLSILSGCGGGGGGSTPPTSPPASPPPAPPTIALAALSAATVNRTTSLTANVTATAAVTRVEFLVDGTVVGTVTTSPYAFAWDTSTVTDGAHSVTARVTDGANNVVTSSAASVAVKNHLTLGVELTPDEIFPRPESHASGEGELTFNLVNGAVTGLVTVTGFQNSEGTDVVPNAAHIHDAYAGSDSTPTVNFEIKDGNALRWGPVANAMLTAEQVNDLLAGKLYVNVHSAKVSTGEIRAQIKPDNIKVVFTQMRGNEVVPPLVVEGAKFALAATTLDTAAMTTVFNANTPPFENPPTGVHIHKAPVGVNVDAALFSLAQDSTKLTHWSSAVQPISAAGLGTFTNNGWYIDLHTAGAPAGLFRGQIRATNSGQLLADLQSTVFTPRCAGCHSGGQESLPGSMNLRGVGFTLDALVNKPSVEQPDVKRVSPGKPDESYLVRKLEGAAGITGDRMPLGSSSLDQATMDKVKLWIATGAEAPN